MISEEPRHSTYTIGKNDKGIIVVSGSSGLIGSAVIKQLSKEYTMVGLDRAGAPYPPEEAVCIEMDITSDSSVDEGFQKIKDEYGSHIVSFIHLAAYYDFNGKESPLYKKITIDGTARLIEALQQFEVEQFIFSSSMLVYRPTEPGRKIHEDSPLQPKWQYPESKVITEKLLHEKRGSIPVVNLRIAGVYNDEGHSIPISNQIQRIYEKQVTSLFYPGNPKHGSPYIHVDDLVEAIAKCIEKRKQLPGETIFNIAEAEAPSYEKLQNIISQNINGKKKSIVRVPKFFAKAGAYILNLFGQSFIKPWMIDIADDHYELDISKAEQVLDWRPHHHITDTIPVMINRLKNDPEKWYKENGLK